MDRLKMITASGVTILLLASGNLLAEEVGMEKTITPRTMADALQMVLDANRTVYTKQVVNRLANEEKVITASEHFEDDQALPLPAQMFRFGAEAAAEKMEKGEGAQFAYSLQSLWSINKQNEPKTDAEKAGLQYVVDNPGKSYYAVEELGGKKYFTAVYADSAVSQACITCHNEHKDSPKTDFKLGDTMGGVVIRIPQ